MNTQLHAVGSPAAVPFTILDPLLVGIHHDLPEILSLRLPPPVSVSLYATVSYICTPQVCQALRLVCVLRRGAEQPSLDSEWATRDSQVSCATPVPSLQPQPSPSPLTGDSGLCLPALVHSDLPQDVMRTGGRCACFSMPRSGPALWVRHCGFSPSPTIMCDSSESLRQGRVDPESVEPNTPASLHSSSS
eukprot:911074-Rhodomonas_salina.2